uniref:Uncharacterized protein n=2 Tax=Micrurus TaxID=8634 RepID=A0A2D4HTE2_MICLE
MMWASTELISNIQEINIETSTWADHNLLKVIWKGQRKRSRWTMNDSILKEKKFNQFMERELDFFFKENRKEETSVQNVWDITAYIRLTIIYVGRRNRKRQTQKVLEEEYKD